MTKEVVDRWKVQFKRRIPKRIDDPEKFGFFDPITGNARLWYRLAGNGLYEFYDAPGYHPQTGEPLQIITREILGAWQKARKEWYVITHDASQPVRYCEAPGIDPVTGRECREIRPQILQRLREYEKGKRPKKIASSDPTFFDLQSGEPIVWYSKDKNGMIEIFDLMGYHPTTGEELFPITKEDAREWDEQQHKVPPQAPNLVPLRDSTVFFDPVTGAPLLWFSRKTEGEYEFFDAPGFNPRNGEPLKRFTKDEMNTYQQKLRDEQDSLERQNKERDAGDARREQEHEAKRRNENALPERPEKQEKSTEGSGPSLRPFDTDKPGQRGAPPPGPEVRPAPQPQQILFDHNGSLMSWQQDGPNVRVVYLKPRRGVVAVGIRRGTVLFAGQWSDQGLVGNAHVFATECPPFPYRVSGGYGSNGVIVMHGAAPVVDPYTCAVLEYTLKSPNAHPSYSLITSRRLADR